MLLPGLSFAVASFASAEVYYIVREGALICLSAVAGVVVSCVDLLDNKNDLK